MSWRLIQDLHAGISRRDWSAVEVAANNLRDEIEKTIAILAGTGIGSVPNDYPLSKLAAAAMPRPYACDTKCEICGGPHDNDILTDICTSCEARINEEGSP